MAIHTRIPRRSTDNGSASLWFVSAVFLAMTIAWVAVSLGTVISGRHAAGGAADLAALAAAARLEATAAFNGTAALNTGVRGGATTPFTESDETTRRSACIAAAQVAARNHAKLTTCRIVNGSVAVEVRVDVPLYAAHRWVVTVRAKARAGPAAVTSESLAPTGNPSPRKHG